MIRLIRSWFQKRKIIRLNKAFMAGYFWAAGELRRGQSIEAVESQIYWLDPSPGGEWESAWRRGAADAVAQYVPAPN
jgi:hypothetical protein